MLPDGKRCPIAYASQTLNEHEKRYAQIDKEALAIMFRLKRFRLYLYGRHFTIQTDHKSLERILGPKSAIPTLEAMRVQGWAIILAAINYSIRFVLLDVLSRLPLLSTLDHMEAVYSVERLIHSYPSRTRKSPTPNVFTPSYCSILQVLGYVKQGRAQHMGDLHLQPYFNRRFELFVEQDYIS